MTLPNLLKQVLPRDRQRPQRLPKLKAENTPIGLMTQKDCEHTGKAKDSRQAE